MTSTRLGERAARAANRLRGATAVSAELRQKRLGAYDPTTGLTAPATVTVRVLSGVLFSLQTSRNGEGLPVSTRQAVLPGTYDLEGRPAELLPAPGDELWSYVEFGERPWGTFPWDGLDRPAWVIKAVKPRRIGGRLISTLCTLGADA